MDSTLTDGASAPHPDSDTNTPAVRDAELAKTENDTMGTARTGEADEDVYPHGIKFALIMGSSYMTMFLVALDRLIVTTAIPQITDEFHSVTDVGWYGSAYLLTNCAFQLFFGKLYVLYSIKAIFLVSLLAFEVGSAICGAAPNSIALIVGGAVAGVGSAGIFSGSIVVLVHALPLHRRPFYQGLFGAVFGLANVISPLLGGAFTDSSATWRWCFYINLPVGGVAFVFIFFLLHIPDQDSTHLPSKQKLARLDGPGLVTLLGGIVCLVLALQWGGTTYAWNNGRVIALLTIAIFLLICFVAIQIIWPNTATVPPRIYIQRSIMTASFSMFATGAVMMTTFYYLPIWFQGIQGVSAVDSGIRLLPTVIGQAVASLAGGAAIQRVGYYNPFMLASIVAMCVGAGLLTTLQVDTSEGKWIGYQILYGAGLGTTLQAPLLAAQTVLPPEDVPIGTSLMFFSQLLGGSIFVSVGQNLFDNNFVQDLRGVSGVNASTILQQGATAITQIPEPTKGFVVQAYNSALRPVFIAGLVMSCLTFLGAAGMEWKSLKRKPSEGGADNRSNEEVPEASNSPAPTEKGQGTESASR
ncbi:MFS general substrate transporter [Hypoxylon sp. FL1284]|nr:MFS general substrate transporter [Hypoxylon sp. FL1284]